MAVLRVKAVKNNEMHMFKAILFVLNNRIF